MRRGTRRGRIGFPLRLGLESNRRAAKLQRDAVALRVFEQTNLVDRADVARREVQRDETTELGHPKSPTLDVHVLPALGLDVRVGNVLSLELAFTRDVALRHGRKSWNSNPFCRSPRSPWGCGEAQ